MNREKGRTIMAKTAKESGSEHEPIRGGLGASILGPRNTPLERENPDQLASPYTDSGTIPNLKFSFATARNRLLIGLGAEASGRQFDIHRSVLLLP
jgi:hypothetical protein